MGGEGGKRERRGERGQMEVKEEKSEKKKRTLNSVFRANLRKLIKQKRFKKVFSEKRTPGRAEHRQRGGGRGREGSSPKTTFLE
jgi:hypothetical protein